MAAPVINIDAYGDALVVLGTAGIVVPMVQRFGAEPGARLSGRRRHPRAARPGLAS